MVINRINKYLSYLICFLPFLFFTGPAIPDIVISLSGLSFLVYSIVNKKFNFLKDSLFICFILFWLVMVASSLFSEFKNETLGTSLVYIRFIFFLMFVKYLFSANEFANKNFFKIILFSISFAAIDGLVQHTFGIDLLGNRLAEKDQYRLDGPFGGHEWILGSYICTYFLIACASIKYLKFNKILSLFFAFALFILCYVVILISGERMALILANFGILIFLLYNIRNLKIFLTFIFLTIFSFVLIYNFKEHSFHRVFTTVEIFGFELSDGKKDFTINTEILKSEKSFWDSHYGSHYLTAIEIFKQNPIIGNGTKTFRYECSKQEYSNINSLMSESRCATHPHNLYFQILSENGIIGLILFAIFVYNVLFIQKKNLNLNFYLDLSIYISIILYLWPIKSSGSIFNNRYALFLYFLISMIFIINNFKRLNGDLKKQ